MQINFPFHSFPSFVPWLTFSLILPAMFSLPLLLTVVHVLFFDVLSTPLMASVICSKLSIPSSMCFCTTTLYIYQCQIRLVFWYSLFQSGQSTYILRSFHLCIWYFPSYCFAVTPSNGLHIRRVWRYQRGSQNRWIEGKTIQWSKRKDKQQSKKQYIEN